MCASPRGQTGKSAFKHAVSMKIYLAAVAGFEESELAGWIQSRDRSNRLALVLLHLVLEPPRMILQPSARPFEGVIDSERQIGVPLVCRRGAFDIDFPTVRKRQPDVPLIKSTSMVMAAWSFQYDPASCHTTIPLSSSPTCLVMASWICGVPAKP
jgi:hypothetical protein